VPYITTEELRFWLAMWRDIQQLLDTQQYDTLVSRYGADFAVHLRTADVPQSIRDVEVQLAQRIS
jgi:hypothetical protein